jgi:hypothetical protein
MEVFQSDATIKPTRNRLPDRRPAVTTAFERDNLNYQMTIGLYPDGRVGEIFLNAEHSNSLLDAMTHDAAIILSIALQFGADPETIRRALKRDSQGRASSPIGAAMDLLA